MVLEEVPQKMSESLLLFLQGLGYGKFKARGCWMLKNYETGKLISLLTHRKLHEVISVFVRDCCCC